MRRLSRYSITSGILFTLGVGVFGHAPLLSPGRADDAGTAAPDPAQKVKTQPKRKQDDGDRAASRVKRALARRAAVALDDQFGPGAATIFQNNGSFGAFAGAGEFGSSATGGSLGFPGFGNGFLGGMGNGGGSSATAIAGAGAVAIAGGAGGTAGGSGCPGGNGSPGGIGSPGGNGGSGTTTETPELNQKVLKFALENMGKQVGNGQCWELGSEALKAAGAEPPHGNVFGDEVPFAQALPGDILEFYDAHFVGLGYWMNLGTPYHTAILYSVRGNTVNMLNQNVNHVMKVQTTVLNLADLVSGSVTVYRPKARSNGDEDSPGSQSPGNQSPGSQSPGGIQPLSGRR